jgi:hypothetical protein
MGMIVEAMTEEEHKLGCVDVHVQAIGAGQREPTDKEAEHIAGCQNCPGIIEEIRQRIADVHKTNG